MKKRVIAAVFALLICIMALSINASDSYADTNGHTRAEAVAWAKGMENTAQKYYTQPTTLECMDLAGHYYAYLGHPVYNLGCPNFIIANTNNRAGERASTDLGWAMYGSDTDPMPGDLVLWQNINNGHIGIVLEVYSDSFKYIDYNGNGAHCGGVIRSIEGKRSFDRIIRPDFPDKLTLDVNGYLDGKDVTNVYGYGTFDMYLGGTRVKQSEGDYWNQEVKTGTSYTIKNIKAADGKVFAGFKSGKYKGTVSQNTTVVMEFRTLNSKEWVKKHSPAQTKSFGGHTYKYYADKVTWIEAFNYCQRLGGHLVVIDSKEENSFVSGLIKETVWLGAVDSLKEGTFIWLDGKNMSYSNWATNQPDNDKSNAEGGEDFVSMYGPETSQSGKWNDVYSYAQYGFVCEIEKPKE